MDDRSTISWMLMGGPRYDEHTQAELDHIRALREQHQEWRRASAESRLARFIAALDRWTARPASAVTADYCRVDGCAAA
jgi:hypothetical protein